MTLSSTPSQLEYTFQRSPFLIFQTAALAAGTNDVIMFTVPTNEIWELHSASGSIVSGGATATASISSNLTAASFDNQVLLGPQVLMVLNLQRELYGGHGPGGILPPGSEVRVHIESAVLNDVLAFRLLAYRFPRGYFAKPIG